MQALLHPSCSRANTRVGGSGRSQGTRCKHQAGIPGPATLTSLSVKPGEEEQEGGRLRRTMANLEGKFQLGFHVSGSRGRGVKGSSWEGFGFLTKGLCYLRVVLCSPGQALASLCCAVSPGQDCRVVLQHPTRLFPRRPLPERGLEVQAFRKDGWLPRNW